MQKRSFGTTRDGKEVFLFSLENKNGVKAEVTNFGANLVNLLVPDKDGNIEDVVLGFDDVSGYEINPSYFGAVIAPSANRIGGGSFELNGTTYLLKKNNGENNLHSDDELGSHKKVWDVIEQENSITFVLKNADPMQTICEKYGFRAKHVQISFGKCEFRAKHVHIRLEKYKIRASPA